MFSAYRTNRAARIFPAANPAGGLDVPGLRAPGRQEAPDAVERGCSAPGVGPFCSCRVDSEKNDARSGPVLASRGRTKGWIEALGRRPGSRRAGQRIEDFQNRQGPVLESTADPDPGGENPSVRLPELAGRVVYLVGFAETEIDRPNEHSPISDLIHRSAAVRGGRGELHRVILDVLKALQRLLERAIAPELGQNALQGRLPARTGSRRRCSMSGAMARRRKINTRVGRRAARERVRELVSEHDDQVVLLIWGVRVLGWSLRRIAAALEGSAAPPGRRAGYTAGCWTAAAGQRICRRYGIPTDRPAPPPRGLLDSLRGAAGPSR